jgi:hypothetical protein
MPPEYKTDPHKVAVWKKLFGALHQRRTLTRADSAAAELLVEDWLRWEVVNAEARLNPFCDVSWRDSEGNLHTKRAESAASKMATAMHRSLMQGLQQFSATPATRAKTKKTKEPALKLGKVKTVRELLEEEQAALDAVDQPSAVEDDMADLASIDETALDPLTPAQALLNEANKLLEEE